MDEKLNMLQWRNFQKARNGENDCGGNDNNNRPDVFIELYSLGS